MAVSDRPRTNRQMLFTNRSRSSYGPTSPQPVSASNGFQPVGKPDHLGDQVFSPKPPYYHRLAYIDPDTTTFEAFKHPFQYVYEPMSSLSDFPVSRIPVVNVATVPQRSPLRYPGGKTWLVPHIRAWLKQTQPEILLEPFVGGGIVSLTAVMEGLVKSAIMVELDRDVAAFWKAALEQGKKLQQLLSGFEPTLATLRALERQEPTTLEEHAFRTLVLNRTRRGGILAPGASFCRQGENGKGVLSRWYPDTLISRLSAIRDYSDRITFFEGDGMELLPRLLCQWGRKAVVFLDPPYAAKGGKQAGTRLYAHFDIDHSRLFELLAEHQATFMMTYDAAPEIINLVRRHDYEAVRLSMKNAHHHHLSELIITSDPVFI